MRSALFNSSLCGSVLTANRGTIVSNWIDDDRDVNTLFATTLFGWKDCVVYKLEGKPGEPRDPINTTTSCDHYSAKKAASSLSQRLQRQPRSTHNGGKRSFIAETIRKSTKKEQTKPPYPQPLSAILSYSSRLFSPSLLSATLDSRYLLLATLGISKYYTPSYSC